VITFALATYEPTDDKSGELEPLRFAILMLFDAGELAAAEACAAERQMEGPMEWIDQERWVVAWEGTPEDRVEIAERLCALEGRVGWSQTLHPGVPWEEEHVQLETNCYQTMDAALSAFGL